MISSHLIPRSKIRQTPLANSCAICLEDLVRLRTFGQGIEQTVQATTLVKTKCGHVFHPACLQEVLLKGVNQNCPLCRREIVSETLVSKDIRCGEPLSLGQI